MIRKQLLAVLLAMMLLPSLLIGWIACDALLHSIRAERIKIVGHVADVRHDELNAFLKNARARIAALNAGPIANCPKPAEPGRDCVLHWLNHFVQTEGAAGAMFSFGGQAQIATDGMPAQMANAIPPFHPEQYAYFPKPSAIAERLYYVSESDSGRTLVVAYPASLLQAIFVNHPDLGGSGETFLADSDGYFITSPRYQPSHGLDHEISARPMQNCLARHNAEVLDEDYRAEPIIHGFRFVSEIGGGCIMAHIEQSEAFVPLQELKKRILFASLMFLAAAFIVAYTLAGRLVRPLVNLTDTARRIGEGDYEVADEGRGKNEISVLARTFNQMMGKLAAASSELENKVVERTRELEFANTSLVERESYIHAVLDAVHSGIVTINERGIVQSVNHAVTKMFGYQTGEIVGQNVKMLMPQPFCGCHDDYLERYMATGEQKVIGSGREVVGLHKNGTTFPIELSICEMPRPEGERAFVGVVTDITVRRAAQNLNLRLIRAIEESPVIIIIADRERNIEYVNPAFSNITGYSREEVIGVKLCSLKSSNMADEVYEEIFARLQAGKSWNGKLEDRRKDGTVFWVSATFSSVRDEQGNIVNFVAVEEDSTERTALENEVRRHRDHLKELVEAQTANIKAIVDTAADSIITIDQSGNVLSFNGAAERMFGYAAEEIIGHGVTALMPEAHRDARGKYITRYLSTGQACIIGRGRELTGQRRDGSLFPLYLAVSEVEIGGAKQFTGIVRDISIQKETEAALIRAREAAEAASQAKSNFLANMSHEIRTPMNAIIGMTDLVLDSPLAPEQEKLLRSVASSAKSLLIILNDILDLSKLESGKMQLEAIPFSLKDVLAEVKDVIQVGADSKGLALSVSLDDSVPPCVVGDPTRLRQVLLNLAGNALKFTQQGSITLAVQPANEAGKWHFSVKDTGIGVAADRQSKLFERFSQEDETTTRRFGGTGLGTSISREIVEHMGGHIWLESELGRGSNFQFTVKLPTAVGIANCRSGSAGHHSERSPHTRPLNILLVEDIVLNQELAVKRLSQRQHLVTVAENGRIAVALFRSEPYDLILMDAMMPEMDGETATRAIRAIEKETGGHIPIIMLTASVMHADQRQYFDAGADGFVGKPIDFNELYSKIADFFPVVEQMEAAEWQTPEKWPPVDGIDSGMVQATWGDWPSYRKALLSFKRDYAETIASLRRQFETGRPDEARMLAHTVKGLAANLGAVELSAAVAVLEQYTKQPSAAYEAALEQAAKQMVRILAAIDGIEPDGSEMAAVGETDAERALPLLEKLATALARSELDEQAIVQLHEVLEAKHFGRIEALIDRFEFDQAQVLVLETITRLRKQGEENG